ncbi:MAG: hypothetical protein AYK22_01375 [Thermoplasmatales archaeon SG8-52-3]|nr:MAG: hypothetical protein AYK22_01375 [Thermoplasmatales archaeon SG8-52-3]
MFETTKVILTENSRSLKNKMREAPILYLLFSAMIIFSIFIFAYATFFFINIDINLNISLEDVFFTVFFMFLLKTVADFYNNFIKASQLSYSLSTNVKQTKTITEVFIAILLIQITIWFSFSILFLIALASFGVNVIYVFEYTIFTIGVIVAVCLGCAISINFFSPKKYRLLPMLILLGFYFQIREPLYVIFTLPLTIIHVTWSIKNSMESHLYSTRKERLKDKTQIKIRNTIKTIFHRETTVLWRDKLLYSFVFTSVSTGIFSGYLFLYGDEILIPEALRNQIGGLLPSMFLFLGIYVVIMYTGVFPSLNLFLNEEKTMWILRHIPVRNDKIIFGKVSSLSLCFLTAIPFIPYITIFTGIEKIGFLIFFLIFSYIAGIIISVPLGVKYVGKKSDIMLLYSVSMILFVILSFASVIVNMIERLFPYPIILYILIILCELLLLYASIKISSQILSLKYKSAS